MDDDHVRWCTDIQGKGKDFKKVIIKRRANLVKQNIVSTFKILSTASYNHVPISFHPFMN